MKGVVEGVKGKVKEVIGAVTGKDELRREGEAQGEKAGALRDVAVKEAEAERASKPKRTRSSNELTKTDGRFARGRNGMYIGVGTVVVILLIVLIVYFLRRA